MNTSSLTKHYDRLTPEETFRLILAAGTRNDEAERHRLGRAARRITLSMPAHAPYGHAYEELSLLTYVELLDAAAFYEKVLACADDALRRSIEEGRSRKRRKPAVPRQAHRARERAGDVYPAWHVLNQASYAAGYTLRVKAEGWRLFRERWHDDPWALWESIPLPGWDRLRDSLESAKVVAFTPAGMVEWFNEVRPDGTREVAETDLITVEQFADNLDATFRHRVRWWDGTEGDGGEQ